MLAIDYLTILPPADRSVDPPPPAAIATWGQGIAKRLSATTRAAAEAADWEYMPASAASADHYAWSTAPGTRRFHYTLRNGAPYHPNAAGMAAVAALVLERLARDQAGDEPKLQPG